LKGFATLHKFLFNTCEYGKIGEVEIKNEGRDYTISIYHEYGKKWSTYLEHYIDKAMRTCLKVIPKFETTENTITYRYQVP